MKPVIQFAFPSDDCFEESIFDDLRREERAKKNRRQFRCHDRMCGALDCPNCYPETYWHKAMDMLDEINKARDGED